MDALFFLFIVIAVWSILLFLATQTWFTIKNPEIGLFYMLIRTQKFSGIIDRLSKKGKTFWVILFDSGIIVALGVIVAAVIMFVINLIKFLIILAIQLNLLSYDGNPTENIVTVDLVPAIPLVSISMESLPYFMIAILFGAAFHELFHGIAARISDIELKSTGIFVFLLFFGAFVEPDEESFKKSNNRAKMRVSAAGALANVLLSVLILFLFLAPVFTAVLSVGYDSTASGVLIMDTTPDEPADLAGISDGWVITGINSTIINNYADFAHYTISLEPGQTIIIEFYKHDSVALTTSVNPFNSSRGFIGISTWDFHKPKYDFLSYQLPYMYLTLLIYSLSINIMLALINLLPLPMLDGDKLVSALLESKFKNHKFLLKIIRWSIGIVFLANFVLTFIIKGWTVI